jgi:hypothetical protein
MDGSEDFMINEAREMIMLMIAISVVTVDDTKMVVIC